MYQRFRMARRAPLCAAILSSILAACTQSMDALDGIKTTSINRSSSHGYSMGERECLARAMFFESHRSSREGLVAVGTVVMNRVASPQYPDTICGVVGQKNQFAPGVLTRPMNSKALPDVMAAADDVLKGERHPALDKAHFFHQAGLKFPYKNMHYVLVAGGNSFYEKRSRRSQAKQMVAAAKPAPQQEETPVIAATTAEDTPALSFDIDAKAADTIGALLAAQARTETD